ncbi:protein yellow-like isoform X2 [Cloeon dipterum]|uniref:protein yellow-like isoform X1 n=1 Tax=Cloeon dipterum TaxID=197152 RepID=UPI00321FEC97
MSPLFSAIFLLGLCLANGINFTTVYQWDKFDFVWPSGADPSIEQIKDEYKPGNVFLRYMAVFRERLFLSLLGGSTIPATLVWLPISGSSTAPPKLTPFPSLYLHKRDNCDSIQEATGMETDRDGRLWMLDNGSWDCPSKFWIFNLLKNDTTERVHHFPDAVVSHSYAKRALRNIVLDKTTDDYLAYITDYFSEHVVVYSRKTNKSWTVKTPGRQWYSLALSANKRQLYLSRFEFKELYSMSVSELKNEGGISANSVKLIGKWNEEPNRMLIDSANVLYAAFWYQNYLSKWNTSEPFREQRFHEVGVLRAVLPFTFALDANRNLWVTERNATEDWTKPKHKLLKAAVGARSYQFGTSKDLPSRG